jgi:hypothetical protein
MREGGSVVTEMPRLDAFDEEFGREPVAVLRGQRRKKRFSAVIGAALGAAIITALAWPWVNADGDRGDADPSRRRRAAQRRERPCELQPVS